MLRELLSAALAGAAKARELFYGRRGLEVVREKEGDVTRGFDREVEEAIIGRLRQELPGAVVYAEESGVVRWGDERYVVVLDPVDGSGNFLMGIPLFTVALAGGPGGAERLGDLSHAVILDVVHGEFAWASNGSWGFSGVAGSKSDVVIICPEDEASARIAVELRRTGLKPKCLGSATYEMMSTVAGRSAAYIDVRNRLRVVDVAAGYVVAKAAGLSVAGFAKLSDIPLGTRDRISILIMRRDVRDAVRKVVGGLVED